MIYAWRYPKSIHRSVMIGVNPPGHFLWDAQDDRRADPSLRRALRPGRDCRSRTPDLAASLHSAYANIPTTGWFLPIKKGNVRVAAFFGLINATADGGGPIAAPRTIDTLLSADKGDARRRVAPVRLRAARVPARAGLGRRRRRRTERRRLRAGASSRPEPTAARSSAAPAPTSSGPAAACSTPGRPTRTRTSTPASATRRSETLLIGGKLDFATPPQNATRELLPHLPNGHQVVLPNLGHADDFWAYEPDASTRLIDTYLDSGRVDTSLYTHQPASTSAPPPATATIAEIVVGVFLGFAGARLSSRCSGWPAAPPRREFGRKRKRRGAVAATRCCSASAAGAWAC